MSALLRHTSSGIPLSFFLKNELSDWQAQQPAFIQNWLTNTGFEKQGVAFGRSLYFERILKIYFWSGRYIFSHFFHKNWYAHEFLYVIPIH